ncbi:hypothetical protein L7F22_027862 [Adiantum nelumboides]|nr:hypothetical protein [Adiantum nelumboides]
MLSTDNAGPIWETLLKFGAVPMGAKCWEHLRIVKGRPAPGKELTDEFNVLEAGLWDTISLSKGCYIGQETVARLVTYQCVKQHLVGLALNGPVDPGSISLSDGEKVGTVTSCNSKPENGEFFGLGYISIEIKGLGSPHHRPYSQNGTSL